MDFNVNVKFDATPELVGAVTTLATALSGCVSPQGQATLGADSVLTITPEVQQPKAEVHTPEVQQPNAPTSGPASAVISDAVVREAVAVKAKAGKKAEIKDLLAEFGVKSSPELPQERRAEFIQKINAL